MTSENFSQSRKPPIATTGVLGWLRLNLFSNWFNYLDSKKMELETNAMSLSTVDVSNSPNTRIVLLKKFSDEGFVFYTNYNSRKGRAIDKNSNVVMDFNTAGMYRAFVNKNGQKQILLYDK